MPKKSWILRIPYLYAVHIRFVRESIVFNDELPYSQLFRLFIAVFLLRSSRLSSFRIFYYISTEDIRKEKVVTSAASESREGLKGGMR